MKQGRLELIWSVSRGYMAVSINWVGSYLGVLILVIQIVWGLYELGPLILGQSQMAGPANQMQLLLGFIMTFLLGYLV